MAISPNVFDGSLPNGGLQVASGKIMCQDRPDLVFTSSAGRTAEAQFRHIDLVVSLVVAGSAGSDAPPDADERHGWLRPQWHHHCGRSQPGRGREQVEGGGQQTQERQRGSAERRRREERPRKMRREGLTRPVDWSVKRHTNRMAIVQ